MGGDHEDDHGLRAEGTEREQDEKRPEGTDDKLAHPSSFDRYLSKVNRSDHPGDATTLGDGTLRRHGVEPFRPEPGAPFDRHESRAVRTVETDDPARANHVAEVLQPGYRLGDRILRPAEVVVCRMVPTEGPAP
jgi:molecular chaperone GrpE